MGELVDGGNAWKRVLARFVEQLCSTSRPEPGNGRCSSRPRQLQSQKVTTRAPGAALVATTVRLNRLLVRSDVELHVHEVGGLSS
eukprot:1591511-Pleurochrysis_carterae.AAC.1